MRHVLAMTPDELKQVLAAVLEYNGKNLLSLHLVEANGTDAPVTSIEVEYDGDPLVVPLPTVPQQNDSPMDAAMKKLEAQRLVMQQRMAALAAAAEGAGGTS